MSARQWDMQTILNAVLEAVRIECDRVVQEEAEAAAERVRKRLAEIAPQLAMRLFETFEVERHQQRVVITVRQDERR